MVKRLPNDDIERLQRIHDSKWLHMGVDRAFLEAQIKEKSLTRSAHQEADRRLDALEAAQAAVAVQSNNKEAAALRNELKRLQGFQKQEQGREKARDWDLSRPDRLLIDRPARVGDDDPRCGVSSIQKFAGEDQASGTCKAKKLLQNRQNWESQSKLRAAQAAREVALEEHFQQQVNNLDRMQLALHEQEQASRKSKDKQLLQDNQMMAQKGQSAREAEIAAEIKQDEAEIAAAMASEFLTESPSGKTLFCPSSQQRPDHYKGMSKRELESIRNEQLNQAREREANQIKQKEEDCKQEQARDCIRAELQRELRQAELARAGQLQAAAKVLQQQILEKQAKDSILQECYRNTVTPAFFEQFETSHR